MASLRRLVKSVHYASRGLAKIIREEQNLKIQFTVAAIVIICGFILKLQILEWMMLVLTISIVILMEIINSAVERVADVLKPRIDHYVKEIKDITAAAVFLSSIISIIIGIMIFLPKIIGLCTIGNI